MHHLAPSLFKCILIASLPFLVSGCRQESPSPATSASTPSSSPPTASASTNASSPSATSPQANLSKESPAVPSEIATFGAGCFWGVEHIFRHQVPGVLDAVSGYSGGTTENPTYKQVCSDDTGHAEVVQVTFDPAKTSYDKIVDAFFRLHDPTQVNRQGPDIGDQYRSVIFYHSESQKQIAERVKAERQKKLTKPIATTIEPAKAFYKAEEYHQRYYDKTGKQPYCHVLRPD